MPAFRGVHQSRIERNASTDYMPSMRRPRPFTSLGRARTTTRLDGAPHFGLGSIQRNLVGRHLARFVRRACRKLKVNGGCGAHFNRNVLPQLCRRFRSAADGVIGEKPIACESRFGRASIRRVPIYTRVAYGILTVKPRALRLTAHLPATPGQPLRSSGSAKAHSAIELRCSKRWDCCPVRNALASRWRKDSSLRSSP